MKPFLDDQFLLNNPTAERLYHDIAKQLPIIDYHCHLSPQEIYENKQFKNLTEAWLYGDHYKWRLMRANGIEENAITGDASDYDRFLAYAKTVPYTIGNPLYHWSHLEMQRFFGIHDLINEANAPKIWESVNAQLAQGGFGARDFINKSNVKVICTTDDPIDSLEYHIKIKEDPTFDVVVLPSFRPDKGLEINRATFLPWVAKLSEVSGQAITNYTEFLQALDGRIAFFHEVGCRVSDHALDFVPFAEATAEEAAAIFAKALRGEAVSLHEENQYKAFTLIHIGQEYARLGWAMQYHMHAHRNNNRRAFDTLGPDTGYDSINDGNVAKALAGLLSGMARDNLLPKTILYSLNPNDYSVLSTLMGSFQGGGTPGKIQLGAAWWFNDTKEGMIYQMKVLADMGLLSRFVGMLTDSRSFLSYTRHEYFRRILCNLIGEWVENGEVPNDDALLREVIEGICFQNANTYFEFNV